MTKPQTDTSTDTKGRYKARLPIISLTAEGKARASTKKTCGTATR